MANASLQHRRPDGGENGDVSKRSSVTSRSSSRASGNGQDFDVNERRTSRGSRPSSRNGYDDKVTPRPGSGGSHGSGRESLGSRLSEGISKSQRSSLGSRHSDTAGKLSTADLSLNTKNPDRESLEVSVDPCREMCQTIDSVDTDALLSSGSQRSLHRSSMDKDDRHSISSVSSGHSCGSQGATGGATQFTKGTHESKLLQDLSRGNKKYYSLAMVSINSSLDVDDFMRQADRASTAASSRDVPSVGEGIDSQAEREEPQIGYELYSPSSALHTMSDGTMQNLLPQEQRFTVDSGRESGVNLDNGSQKSQRSQKSDAGSQRSSLESQRSREREHQELAHDTSERTIQDRSVLNTNKSSCYS